MPSIDGLRSTGLQGIQLKGDATTGKGSGCIDFPSVTALPTTTGRYYLGVQGGSLVFVANGSATTVGTAGGGVATWDTLYDLDSTLAVDSTSLTFAGSHDTNDVITITNATGSGDCVQITQSGTGKDIQGTSNTWNITKAGVVTATGLTMSDDQAITLGATSDATIQWVNASSFTDFHGAVNFDGAITLETTTTIVATGAATGTAVVTLTAGDLVLSDGVASITQSADATALTIVADAQTTTNVIDVNADAVTSGTLLHLDTTAATFTGKFIDCYNGAATVMSVGLDGATTIASTVNSTLALTVTGIQTSENLVKFDNTAGVIASTKAVLLLDAGGYIASGGNILRVAPTGTPNAGAIGIEYVGASKTNMGLYVDSDPTATHVVQFHGGGALTDGKAVLALTNDGNLATGGNLLNITVGGTPNAAAIAAEIASAKDCQALVVTTSAATDSGVEITGDGAIANNKAILEISATGTPANAGSNIVRIDGSAMTATNTPIALEIDAHGKDLVGAFIDSDSATNSAVLINGGGAIANNKAVLEVTADGTPANTGSNVVRIDGSGMTATNKPILLELVGTGKALGGIYLDTDNTTTHGVSITGTGNLSGANMLYVANDGTPAAATDYLVSFDYSSATMTNNPVTFRVNGKDSTASTVQITGSGVLAAGAGTLELVNTHADAVGAALILRHTSASPANSDVVGSIQFYGNDSGAASQQWGKIHSVVTDVTATSEDADLVFSVMKAGTLATALTLDSDVVGVVVGSGAGAATVTSNGAYDLTVSTASTAANEPRIVLTDGAAGNITITAGATSGEIDLASPVMFSPTQALTGAGALTLTTSISEITTTGADALTLADGVEGQIKFCLMVADGGEGTLTPDNPGGFATIKFNDVGDSCILIFTNAKWYILSNNGCTVA